VKRNLSTQAKKLKEEFSLSDDNARELDRKIKALIEKKKQVDDSDILDCVKTAINSLNLTDTDEVNTKINNVAGMYSENDAMFSMQNVWFGILAYWGTIATMIVDVVCSESFIKYLSLSIIYLVLLVIFIFAVNKKNIHNLKLKYFLESFNDASTCTSLITSIFYCIGKILTPCTYVDILIIVFSVLYVTIITINRYIYCVKYVLNKPESLIIYNKVHPFYQKLKERLAMSLNTSFLLMAIIMICIGLYPLLSGNTPNSFRCALGLLLLGVWFATFPIINEETKVKIMFVLVMIAILSLITYLMTVYNINYFISHKLEGNTCKDIIFCCFGIVILTILIYFMLCAVKKIKCFIYKAFTFFRSKVSDDIPNFVSWIIAVIFVLFILAIVILVLLAITKSLIF
jgi:hypothetical protein